MKRSLITSLVALTFASGALAADPGVFSVESAPKLESSKDFMLEVKLGPYSPLVDRPFESTGKTPFADTFGTTPLILAELEFEFEIFKKFGVLSGGISGGYTEKFGRTLDAATGLRTTTPTGLRLVPIKALIAYRFDVLSLRYHIPLVPYAKLAFVAMPWWVTNGAELEVLPNGSRAIGVKYGIAGTAGLAFTLDFIDQRLARDFDNSAGVNHSYIFVEFTVQEVNDFGIASSKAGVANTTPFDFSSRHWSAGLAFEF